MRRSTLLCLIAATSFFVAGSGIPARAMGGAPDRTPELRNAGDWKTILEETGPAGLEQERVLLTLARLEAYGYTPAEVQPTMGYAVESARNGLPAEWVLDKIDEGALKRIPAAELQEAASHRAKLLQRAMNLVNNANGSWATGGILVLPAATAMESGLGEDILRSVLERGVKRDSSEEQMKAVIEAGEDFHLAGLDDESVQNLMLDCLNRNLRRIETVRVVRYIRDNAGHGMAGAELRSALWSNDNTLQKGAGAGPGNRVERSSGGAGSGGGSGGTPGTGSGNKGGTPGAGHGGRH